MKFEDVFTYEHLFESAKKCCNGVRWKPSTQMFEIRISRWVSTLYNELHSGKYKSKGFTEFDILERGKIRHIRAVHISERCVQKCLCEYCLKPILVPKLIYDNSANIKGRGTHFAIKRLKKHLAWHYKKHGTQGGILLIDFSNYFASVPHGILLDMLKRDIKDERLYGLCSMFINCFKGGVGLGLGSEVSQILAVYYPNSIDHYVKEQLHIKGYGRYMDDSYLIHEDIEYLKYCRNIIEAKCNELGLVLNQKRTRIIPLTDGFSYLKKRFHYGKNGEIVVRLARSNITRRRRTLKKQAHKGIDARQSYDCWRGYAKHYNSYQSVRNMDNVYFKFCSHGKVNYGYNNKRMGYDEAQ